MSRAGELETVYIDPEKEDGPYIRLVRADGTNGRGQRERLCEAVRRCAGVAALLLLLLDTSPQRSVTGSANAPRQVITGVSNEKAEGTALSLARSALAIYSRHGADDPKFMAFSMPDGQMWLTWNVGSGGQSAVPGLPDSSFVVSLYVYEDPDGQPDPNRISVVTIGEEILGQSGPNQMYYLDLSSQGGGQVTTVTGVRIGNELAEPVDAVSSLQPDVVLAAGMNPDGFNRVAVLASVARGWAANGATTGIFSNIP